MRRLVLLRHGRTAWNAERRFQGHADPPLDDVGREQAWEAARVVAALRPDLLVTSDAQRARGTAEPIGRLAGLPVQVEPRLRERSLGSWEGLTRDEVEVRFPDQYAEWVAGGEVPARGGESRAEVADRAAAALAALPPVPLTVVVTHSATALAVCARLLGVPLTLHALGPLLNCHWSELRTDDAVTPGGATYWRLYAHNAGAPGSVVPLPVPIPADDAEDGALDAQA